MNEDNKPTTPRLDVDPDTGAIYLYLNAGRIAEEQVEVEVPGAKTRKQIIVDLDADGEIIGIEIITLA